jgi:hypothetical protein
VTGQRPLFLHEFIDIVGQHQWDYMEHVKGQAGDANVDFALLGTWYTMGVTGRWPQVVNVWNIPDGWDAWLDRVDRLGLKRKANRDLEGWWEVAYGYRTGGFDRLLAGAPGCPTAADLVADGVRGSLFVHELTQVRPGAALDYLAAVRDERAPLMAEYDHRLIGLWEVMMTDVEACTVWATEPEHHVRMAMARDVARGLLAADVASVDGDERIERWHAQAREWTTRWREELMTPAPGTLCAPEAIPVDDGADA